jgi:proline iminopeptidase
MARSAFRRLTGIAVLPLLAALAACAEPAPPLTPGEGTIEMPGGTVWYNVVGDGPGTPLVLLHGGPGAPSYYLNPLAALGDGRPVIFYDQLGAGRSDRTTDSTLWTIPSFVAELDSLRRALGLREVHILGHSWGTMLATQYFFAHPEGVESLILASPALNTAEWVADADTLLLALPDSSQAAIARHEAAGTFEDPEYQAAVMAFYQLYLARAQPWDANMDSTFAGLNEALYQYMWGPSEFTATGALRNFDVTDSLALITVPTLFMTGEYDEARPTTVENHASLVPGAEFAVIPDAAHITMHDNPDETLRVVREFLGRVDERD